MKGLIESPVGEDCQLDGIAFCEGHLGTVCFHAHLNMPSYSSTWIDGEKGMFMKIKEMLEHTKLKSLTCMRMSCPAVMWAQQRGSTTTVLMSSMRTAGPLMSWPGRRSFSKYAGVSCRPPTCDNPGKDVTPYACLSSM